MNCQFEFLRLLRIFMCYRQPKGDTLKMSYLKSSNYLKDKQNTFKH
jgi:hypothetical protein